MFLAWWLYLLKTSSCCWFFFSALFCCLIGRLLLKAAAYVLLILYWLLLLVFFFVFFLVWLIKLQWRVSGLFFCYFFTILELAIFVRFLSPNLLDCYFLVFSHLFLYLIAWGRVLQKTRSFLKKNVFYSVNFIYSGGDGRLSKI